MQVISAVKSALTTGDMKDLEEHVLPVVRHMAEGVSEHTATN